MAGRGASDHERSGRGTAPPFVDISKSSRKMRQSRSVISGRDLVDQWRSSKVDLGLRELRRELRVSEGRVKGKRRKREENEKKKRRKREEKEKNGMKNVIK